MTGPLSPSTNPADLLEDAAAMLAFLADTAPCLQAGGGHCGLNEVSAHGLYLILQDVTATITQARRLI